MSSDQPKRDRITENLRLAYGSVVSETIPDAFLELLRQIDDGDDNKRDPDAGIAAEPPKRPKDGPKSSGAAAPVQPLAPQE